MGEYCRNQLHYNNASRTNTLENSLFAMWSCIWYIYIYTMRLYLSNNTLLVNTVHRLKSQALDNVNWITKYGHCKRQLSSRGLWILKIHILQWKVFSTVIASFVTYSFNKLCVILFLAPLCYMKYDVWKSLWCKNISTTLTLHFKTLNVYVKEDLSNECHTVPGTYKHWAE